MRTLVATILLITGLYTMAQSFQRIYGDGGIWSPTAFAASPDAYYLLHIDYTNDSPTELVKLDHAGDTIWARSLPHEGRRIAYGEGSVVVTLETTEAGQHDIIVVKLDTSGNVVWANRTSFPENGLLNYNSRVHVLPDGVLTTGQKDMGLDFNTNLGITLARYDANGELLWGKTFASPFYPINALASVMTQDGDLIVAGTRGTSLPDLGMEAAMVLMRFSSEGEPVWMRAFNDTMGSTGLCIPVDLVVTHDGNYALLAQKNDDQVVVTTFDGTGDLIWGNRLTPDAFWPRPRNLIQDSADRFVISGGGGSSGPSSIFLMRLGPDGSYLDAVTVADQGYAYAPLYATTAFGQELVEQEGTQGYVVSHGFNPNGQDSWHALTTIDADGMPGCAELGTALPFIAEPVAWNEEPWPVLPTAQMSMTGEFVTIITDPIAEHVADMCPLITALPSSPSHGADLNAWTVPSGDQLFCSWTEPRTGPVSLELLDISGRVVLRENAYGPQPFVLAVAPLARGAFLLRVVSSEGTATRHVLLH